jgi:hypothetical protein
MAGGAWCSALWRTGMRARAGLQSPAVGCFGVVHVRILIDLFTFAALSSTRQETPGFYPFMWSVLELDSGSRLKGSDKGPGSLAMRSDGYLHKLGAIT